MPASGSARRSNPQRQHPHQCNCRRHRYRRNIHKHALRLFALIAGVAAATQNVDSVVHFAAAYGPLAFHVIAVSLATMLRLLNSLPPIMR